MTDKKKAPKITGKKQGKKPGTFPKGKSGNPNGRPSKGTSYKERIAVAMAKKGADFGFDDDKQSGVEVKDLIIDEQIKAAVGGDRHAIKWLSEREEGMPQQYVEQVTKNETEVRVIE